MATAVPPPIPQPRPASPPDGVSLLAGTLHVYVAFDWGDEIDLDQARRLAPADQPEFPRRRRTPSSISYRPPPLRFLLDPWTLDLPGAGPAPVTAEATVFDFGAVSVA